MDYVSKLHVLCEAKGWGPSDLWRALGGAVVRGTVYNWFDGKGRPDITTGLKVARTLGIPLDVLADDEAELPPARPAPDYEAKVRDLAADTSWELIYRRAIGVERTTGIESRPGWGGGGSVSEPIDLDDGPATNPPGGQRERRR